MAQQEREKRLDDNEDEIRSALEKSLVSLHKTAYIALPTGCASSASSTLVGTMWVGTSN